MPIVPTPAAARYSAAGDPSPPAPMQSTLPCLSFSCPSTPTSGMMRCRLYRWTSSFESAIYLPPATEGMMLIVSPGFTAVFSFSR